MLAELIDRARQNVTDHRETDRLYGALADGTVKNADTFQSRVESLEAQSEDIIKRKSQS